MGSKELTKLPLYFLMVGMRGWENQPNIYYIYIDIVGVDISFVRIPAIKGGMTIPKIRSLDPGTYVSWVKSQKS